MVDYLKKIDETIALSMAKGGRVYRCVINDMERLLIEKALRSANGNQILAARILGLNRNTLRTKIRKLNINLRKFRL